MPYRVRKIEPLDLNKRKAIGIALPFSSDSVFVSTYQTIDAYKSNLLNYFLTDRGSRYLNPNFGNTFRKFIFEQPLSRSEVRELEYLIREDIKNYFPKLVIDELNIDNLENDHILQIFLKFHIRDTESSGDLTLQFT